MADLIFTIPDEYIPDLLEAFADKYGYQDEIEDPEATPKQGTVMIPNPQTKAEFARAVIVQLIKDTYIRYKAKVDAQTAVDAAAVDARTDADNFTGA